MVMDYVSEIISFLAGGIAGSLVTLSVRSLKATGRASIVDQSGSKAGGDIVGRDKISK